MGFNSLEFLLFLPVVFLLYWFLCRNKLQQNLLIVVLSYIFYGWWDWRFLLLIVFTSLSSYVSGIAINYYNDERKQKLISAANVITNLVILGVFKYYNFFADSFAVFLEGIGYHIDVITLNVILPVGISFYTFQALSYSIDVFQGKLKPTRDIIQFFAYICFFPQLVAGPIERATNLLPQFNQKRQFDYAGAVDGLRQMLWGFFKKVVVADLCAYYVNQYWDNYEELSGLMLIQISVLFTFQIYCDFSGYSDIAIGCAKLFGIRLMKNFDMPYFSRNIAEFWRKWHISLMTWFRDYLYIPLGGNRSGRIKSFSNIIVVFLISGLWHGANWTFVMWGLYNGLLLVIASLIGCNNKYKSRIAEGRILPDRKETLSMCITFLFVVIGWIIFRSQSLIDAVEYIHFIFCNNFVDDSSDLLYTPFIVISLLLVLEWKSRTKQHVYALPIGKCLVNRPIRWASYYIMIFAIYCMWGYSHGFIYFQF